MDIYLLRISLLSFYLTLLTSLFSGFYYHLLLTIDICKNDGLLLNNIGIGLISLLFFYLLLTNSNSIRIKYNTVYELLLNLLLFTIIYLLLLISLYYLHSFITFNIINNALSSNINKNCIMTTYENTILFVLSIISTTYIRDIMTIICLSYGY